MAAILAGCEAGRGVHRDANGLAGTRLQDDAARREADHVGSEQLAGARRFGGLECTVAAHAAVFDGNAERGLFIALVDER